MKKKLIFAKATVISYIYMEFKINSIADEMDFRDRVINNEPRAVDFFLKKYSWSFLNYIGREIMHENPCMVYDYDNKCYIKDYGMGLMGEYYLFITAKILPPPQWDKLRMYKGNNSCRFYTYLNVITTRYFMRLKIGESKNPSNPGDDDGADVLKNGLKGKSTESLPYHKNDGIIEDDINKQIIYIFFDHGDVEKETRDLAMMALKDLKTRVSTTKGKKINGEKDYWVLFYSINDYDYYDIAEELKEYFPRPIDEIRRQDVQTRVAQWKLRAVNHLVDMILDRENKSRYSLLRDQIIRHSNYKKNR